MKKTIGFIQFFPLFGEKTGNFQKILGLLNGTKADLIVLPELFATGYTFTSGDELRSLAEKTEPPGETISFLKHISSLTGAVIVGGFAEEENGDYFNSSAMVYRDQTIGIYRKIHLFQKEKLWFKAGNRPLEVHTVQGMRVGMMICFDWIFPETCRVLALKGAQVIAHPTNLVMPYCQQAMVTRCLENRVFAVTANRIGTEKRGDEENAFTGGSQITSFDGRILASAPSDNNCLAFTEIDPERAENKKINDFNDLLQDRRPEFYQSVSIRKKDFSDEN
ncbi:MAG: nitrilase-related carbon-nitrogen hydrolase [Thermodesulfobacteriota bacterium]